MQRAGEAASLVITNVRILDPAAGIDRTGDLVVRDGIVGGNPDGLERIDGTGLVAAPGFVDPHVHVRTPGREDCEDIATGTKAAAAGGFVTVVAMPNTTPVVDNAAILGSLLERATREAAVRIGFYAAITVGQNGTTLSEQGELADLGAVGFSDDGRPVVNAEILRRAYRYQQVTGRPLVLHEEDNDLSAGGVMHEGLVSTRLGMKGIPDVSESVQVARDATLAAYEDAHIHICHLSACKTVEVVRLAKAQGVRITAEVSPHHLALTDEAVLDLDAARHKMNPPLRSEDDRLALIDGLLDGTIDCIATDHAPHAPQEKERPFEDAPFGVTGLETAFAACYTHLVATGLMPLDLLIRRMSGDAAAVVGLPIPTLADGAVADVALLDLGARERVGDRGFQSRSNNSAFLGDELTGKVLLTIAGGQIAWRT